jgi:DNA-binding response OmpR family regulator
MSILVIEDEKKLAEILRKALKSERYAVDSAYDGAEGLKKALKGGYALIVLDIMLPKKNGFDVCKELRAAGIDTPIIMLTARATLEDRVNGLDLGADDYLVKPFGIEELFARIRALLRREKKGDPLVLKVADISIDTKSHDVRKGNKVLPLSPKEYILLETLLRKPGEALTRRQLLDAAWGPEFRETNHELNVHMRYLRRKVDTSGKAGIIKTIRGVGYAAKA